MMPKTETCGDDDAEDDLRDGGDWMVGPLGKVTSPLQPTTRKWDRNRTP